MLSSFIFCVFIAMFFLPCVGLLVVEFPPIASHCPLREGRSGSLRTRGASAGLGCRAEKVRIKPPIDPSAPERRRKSVPKDGTNRGGRRVRAGAKPVTHSRTSSRPESPPPACLRLTRRRLPAASSARKQSASSACWASTPPRAPLSPPRSWR